MRIFLDANILFSAAKSAGTVRHLLQALRIAGHILVGDEYVATEARRNIAAKAATDATDALQVLLKQIEVSVAQHQPQSPAAALWLAGKDRLVLLAAMALQCDALVTGDRPHFGAGYGKTFDGVTLFSPAQLALALPPALPAAS